MSADAAAKVGTLIADAVAKGAVLVAGGKIEGAIAQATVVDRVTPEMKIYAQESFGPVVSVIRVRGDEEAVRVANDSEYGLSAAIFSRGCLPCASDRGANPVRHMPHQRGHGA